MGQTSQQQQKNMPNPIAKGKNNNPMKKPDAQSGYGKNSGKENDNLTRDDNKNDPLKGPNA